MLILHSLERQQTQKEFGSPSIMVDMQNMNGEGHQIHGKM